MSNISNTVPSGLDPSQPLAQYWDKPVSELVRLPDTPISDAEQERHTLYCLLLMALVENFWNGNKRGQDGEYPWRESQRREDKIYQGGRYLGHNIACLAVDGNGEVIDFDFNHNDLFSSSVEHAESRLVRRIFSLTQIYDNWRVLKPGDPSRSADYLTILSNITIYTSLESCAQCSGIMALGKVKAVVYLQQDPGQFSIGNILRNLTTDALRAPLPISADQINLAYSLKRSAEQPAVDQGSDKQRSVAQHYQALNKGYQAFAAGVSKDKPFYRLNESDPKPDASRSITSFLCTDEALSIFQKGKEEFDKLELQHPEYKPNGGKDVLSNAHTQIHTQRFYAYASTLGQRGTPHKL